jgi:hypothetical protein
VITREHITQWLKEQMLIGGYSEAEWLHIYRDAYQWALRTAKDDETRDRLTSPDGINTRRAGA